MVPRVGQPQPQDGSGRSDLNGGLLLFRLLRGDVVVLSDGGGGCASSPQIRDLPIDRFRDAGVDSGIGGGRGGRGDGGELSVVVRVEDGRGGGVVLGDRHPGVREDPVEGYSGAGLDPQAPLDEVAALSRQADAEVDLGRADLLVLLEGDVAADHVVEEDAQRPHGGGWAVVPIEADPLWRGVNPRT